MSEVDFESQVLSGDEDGGEEKLVPVREAIRYRKRAQGAEQAAAELGEQVRDLKAANEKLSGELSGMKVDQELSRKLEAAGVCDVEAAILIAKDRMGKQADAGVDGVIEQMRKEKGYLFDEKEGSVSVLKTAGVKENMSGGQRVLESAGKKAVASGSRVDLHEYMRMRRNFV